MEKITLVTLEEWNKMTKVSEIERDTGKRSGEIPCSNERSRHMEAPYIILGSPCKELLDLQQAGHPVLAELTYLQGLSEEAVAEALCKEEAIREFTNVCIHARELPQGYLRRILCKARKMPVLITETDRLIIRESMVEDGSAFYELYQDEASRKYLEALPIEEKDSVEQNIKEYERYITDYQKGQYAFYEYGMWSIVEKASGRCIGRAGVELQAEGFSLGYALLPQFRGKGYVTEACMAVLEYSKECEYADKIYVKIARENEASLAVYGRLKKQSLVTLKISKV